MKKLQSLNEDTFKNLEGFKIENLSAIRGGDTATGAGSKASQAGGCYYWESDCQPSSGPMQYYGVTHQK